MKSALAEWKEKIDAAKKLFVGFHEREPRGRELRTVSVDLDVTLEVGKIDGLIYTASGDGKKYIHRFKKNARPVLVVTHDGKQIYALAGAYKFSARGFEDRK